MRMYGNHRVILEPLNVPSTDHLPCLDREVGRSVEEKDVLSSRNPTGRHFALMEMTALEERCFSRISRISNVLGLRIYPVGELSHQDRQGGWSRAYDVGVHPHVGEAIDKVER